MKYRSGLAALLLAAIVAGCSQTPPEVHLIQQAADAIGGTERIQAATTLVIEGKGTAGHIGQDLTPEATTRTWDVIEYRRSVDLNDHRWNMQQTRKATFPYSLDPTQRQNQGLDGDIAYNIRGPQNTVTRASALVARERRLEMLHHPLAALRAALDKGSKVERFRVQGALQLVDITTSKGDTITLAVDRGSHLPITVASTSYNDNLGDVVIETTFADYQDSGGLLLPKRLTTKLDQYMQLDLTVAGNAVDAQTGDLAAPAEAATAAEPPVQAVYEITPQRIAKGIWLLPGGHNSVVFEFADHLTLVEVPLNESRALAVIAAARTVAPGKPLTQAIITHHHFDHSGGLRAAVAEGLMLITHQGNERFIDAMVARPHTIVQDKLAKSPKPAHIETVDDEKMYKDDAMELRLYHLKNSSHSQTMLIAFAPSEGMLIQADLYSEGSAAFPSWDTLQQNIAERQLKVEKHVPIHGAMKSAKEAAAEVAAKATST